MSLEKVNKLQPSQALGAKAKTSASKSFTEILDQRYKSQGKPRTQDSVRLRPDGVLTQQGASPKPTGVGDKKQESESMQVPHSLVGKKADPFFKPLPAGSTATYQSPTKISAETQGVKIDKNPSKKLHVEGKITPTQLRKTASVSSSSNAIPKNMESYRPLIEKHAQINNLDPNLLAALIKQESNFRPDVVSHAGAMGLTQLMPGTARSVGVTDPLNPEQSIAGGARYLRQMLDRFNGNTELALAAYNAGPGAVARYGGIPPFRETRRYVQSVTANLENIRSTGLFASTSPPKTRV